MKKRKRHEECSPSKRLGSTRQEGRCLQAGDSDFTGSRPRQHLDFRPPDLGFASPSVVFCHGHPGGLAEAGIPLTRRVQGGKSTLA